MNIPKSHKPRVFIASPLFNPAQIAIIRDIETLLAENDFSFYSARLHSGSDKLTPEQKRDLRAWDPIFESNVQGLDDCDVMIAVLEYAFPDGQQLVLQDRRGLDAGADSIDTVLELPDAGTVWEMGYHQAQGKLVLGFHSNKGEAPELDAHARRGRHDPRHGRPRDLPEHRERRYDRPRAADPPRMERPTR